VRNPKSCEDSLKDPQILFGLPEGLSYPVRIPKSCEGSQILCGISEVLTKPVWIPGRIFKSCVDSLKDSQIL
jgi:hypothetical protein